MLKLYSIISVILFCSTLGVSAQINERTNNNHTYTKPPKTSNLLFYIQRSLNRNTIAYELNTDDKNVLDLDDPIHPYWIRYESGGHRRELSYIEKKFAYGIKTKLVNQQSQNYKLSLVSYPVNMELKKSGDEQNFKVFITVNNKLIELEMIYFKAEGGTFWNPNIKYIDIYGTEVKTKLAVKERIIP